MFVTAAVATVPGESFTPMTLELDDPRPGEVLVEIAGVGVCHTDLVARDGGLPLPFPSVLGHEGAGTVVRVGEGVRKVQPGDRVVLTFMSCGLCRSCEADAPAYCERFRQLNTLGTRTDGSPTLRRGEDVVAGSFFGQSSFATHALAHERNVVPVPPDMPLDITGVLGCGVQTGAGAVLRSMDCAPASTLLVVGGGVVGLSAVMAARVRGLSRILVSERQPSRRELARELGAHDAIDPGAGDLAEAVVSLLPLGVDYVLDTTGIPAVIEQVPRLIARRGTFGFVGIPPAGHTEMPLPFPFMDAMRRGLTLRGIIEGDSDLDPFIESLMDLYRQGEFPFDKLVRRFPLADINEAIEAQHRGDVLKIVLLPREART